MVTKEAICRETAGEEVKGWEKNFDVILSPETSERLTRVVMAGRITFDEQAETFALKLRRPLELENGSTVESLTIREPRTAEIRQAGKKGDEMELVLRLLSTISGQPLGVLDRMGSKDFTIVGELFNFFV